MTAPAAAARDLARRLVEARLAACVNLVAGVTSVYRWEGDVHEDSETLCVVKTTAERLPALEAWLGEHHPYDVPECIALTPTEVEARYLAWLRGACADASDGGSA